MVKMISF